MPLLSLQSPVQLWTTILSTAAPEILHLESAPAETGTPAKHKEQSSSAFLLLADRSRAGLGMRILRDQIEMQILINVAEERECC
jgi:hypothetical protein